MQGFNQKQLDQLVPIIQKQVKQLQISGGWETVSEGEVKGYTKKSNGNSVITKGQTVINVALQKVVDFFMAEDSFKKLNDSCILNKVVHEKKGKYKVSYFQMKTPFPLDNRDAVNLTTWINEGNKFYLCIKACNYPVQVPQKFVRAHMNISCWIFQKVDNNRTKVTTFSDMDPMGNIPDFVKNGIAGKRVQILKSLQKIIKS